MSPLERITQRSAVRRQVLVAGLVPTVCVAVLAFLQPSWLSSFERSTYDVLLRRTAPRPPSGRVVIVDVDERSLTTIGQWPWRRDLIGQLISDIRDRGAAVVALDMVFAEHDRAEAALDGSGTTSDAAFAQALSAGRVVLGYAMRFDEPAGAAPPCVLHPIGLAVVRTGPDAPHTPLFEASGAICNLPNLAQAAGRSGFLNAAPDPDGILRRVPLLIDLDGRIYPSLALAAVGALTGSTAPALQIAHVNHASFRMGAADVALDGRGQMLVRYRGPKRTFHYFSAADVLGRRLPPGVFDGRLVFVGTTALGTREVVATPLDTLFAGVEVQATAADNLLQRDSLGRHQHAVAIEGAAVLVGGLTAVLLALGAGLTWSAVAAAAGVVLLWVGAVWTLDTQGTFLSPLFPTAGLAMTLGGMTLAQVSIERRRADQAGLDRSRTQQLMLQALLSLTETRDAETGQHARRTQHYTRLVAEELADHPRFRDYLTPARIDLISSLAPLHDIGKVGVPDHVLNKPGKLTPDEYEEMKRHPAYGRDVILRAERQADVRDDETLELAKEIVYTHHEQWDGNGYPEGLRGDAIPVAGRILALVDVYDAVVSRRVYAPPMSFEEACAFVVKRKGSHFDPAVVEAFLRVEPAMRLLSAEPYRSTKDQERSQPADAASTKAAVR
jgi:adenylate cyclase